MTETARRELTPATDPYALPVRSGVWAVTPSIASSWLSHRDHPANRPISKSVAGRYQADMEAGRWMQGTPEGWIFDTEGFFISGRHRAKALANSGLTLKVHIFVDQPRDIAPYLDQGHRRTAAHLLGGQYATQIGAAARHLAAVADGDPWGMPRYSKVTIPEVVATHAAWPELAWRRTDVVGCHYDAGIPAAPHLAVIAQAERTKYRAAIDPWLEGIRSGAGLTTGDPRLHLRNRFRGGLSTQGGANRRDHAYALIVKAWNAFALGERLTVLRWATAEGLPRVVGTDAEGKAA